MYIFTPPAVAYDLKFTYAELAAYIERGRSRSTRKLGTTVMLSKSSGSSAIEVWLYQTKLGTIGADGTVRISAAIDSHGSHATTWWVQKMISDNGHRGLVAREKGRYAVAGKVFTR